MLREASAEDGIQEQIEYAIRAATGEHLPWPRVAGAVGGSLPVVLLDGFDELLQATSVSQSDYLLKVARFQQREADQDRPVVVLVTSRTAVADRRGIPKARSRFGSSCSVQPRRRAGLNSGTASTRRTWRRGA